MVKGYFAHNGSIGVMMTFIKLAKSAIWLTQPMKSSTEFTRLHKEKELSSIMKSIKIGTFKDITFRLQSSKKHQKVNTQTLSELTTAHQEAILWKLPVSWNHNLRSLVFV